MRQRCGGVHVRLTPWRRGPARAVLTAGFSAVALALGLSVGAPPAGADTLDDLEAQQEQLAAQQAENALQREQVAAALEGTNAALADTYLALQDINARLPIARAEYEAAQVVLGAKEREAQAIADRLGVAEAQQATLTEEIAAGEAEEAQIRTAIGQLARTTYRDGGDLSALAVMLEATSTDDLAARYSAMDTARRTQTQALTELEHAIAVRRTAQARLDAVEERITALKVEADAAVAAAEEARDTAAARAAEIEQLQRDAVTKAAELETQKSQYQSQQAQLEADDRAVADEIAALAAQEAVERERIRVEAERRAAAEAAAGNGSGTSGAAGSSGAATTASLIIPPISGSLYVTSPYGYRVYPITGGWYMHNGVDLRSACGNPQYAAAAGTVVKIGYEASNGTHGNQVIINHGILGGTSTVTVYNHLSRFAVSLGARVTQGQVIGYTGATGAVTGCHVHFELWLNGSTVDPMDYL